MSEDKDAEMMYCASCGIAQVDEIKLKKCNACQLVRYCGVEFRDSTGHNTKRHAKNGQLNYVTRFYSSNQSAPILGTVRSV